MSCSNDMSAKYCEVADAMGRLGHYPGMLELWQRGAFRHAFDVALARIELEKWGLTIEEVEKDLHDEYVAHRCDPVLPGVPS